MASESSRDDCGAGAAGGRRGTGSRRGAEADCCRADKPNCDGSASSAETSAESMDQDCAEGSGVVAASGTCAAGGVSAVTAATEDSRIARSSRRVTVCSGCVSRAGASASVADSAGALGARSVPAWSLPAMSVESKSARAAPSTWLECGCSSCEGAAACSDCARSIGCSSADACWPLPCCV